MLEYCTPRSTMAESEVNMPRKTGITLMLAIIITTP